MGSDDNQQRKNLKNLMRFSKNEKQEAYELNERTRRTTALHLDLSHCRRSRSIDYHSGTTALC